MVKKVKATKQLFSVAAKQFRADQRLAREALSPNDQTEMDESIVPADILAPMPEGSAFRVTQAQWEGRTIAFFSRNEGSYLVNVAISDDYDTQMEIRNIEACRSLLTARSVLRAIHFPGAGANLAALVRQRDAQADHEQIGAATGQPSATHNQIRLRGAP